MMSRFVVFVALGGLGLACDKGPVAAPPAAPVDNIQRVEFDPATLERLGIKVEAAGTQGPGLRLQLPGTLEYIADNYAEVGTVVEGRVTSVKVTVGDRVKRGQALATILIPAIVTAQAEALTAQAEVKVTKDQLKRETALLANQLTTKREEEIARGDATRAEADLAAALAKLKLYGAAVPSSSEAINATGAITLVSPIDGVVVARNAVVGGYLEPKDTAFAVGNATKLSAVLDVYESDVPSIREGAEAEIHVDAVPGEVFRGKIGNVEPQVGKSSRALRARVVLNNTTGALRPGLFVRALVPIAPAAPGSGRLPIPKSAVQQLGGSDVVFVERTRGKYEVRPVIVAHRTSQIAEITDGLALGERIVVHGAFILRGEVTKQ